MSDAAKPLNHIETIEIVIDNLKSSVYCDDPDISELVIKLHGILKELNISGTV